VLLSTSRLLYYRLIAYKVQLFLRIFLITITIVILVLNLNIVYLASISGSEAFVWQVKAICSALIWIMMIQ